MEFKIEKMWRHQDGFCVATVLSFRTQEVSTLHDRWGSWLIGDPDGEKGSALREAAVISHDLAASLQEYKRRLGNKIEVHSKPNVFLQKYANKPNPFINKAAKKNPLIARLAAQGKIK